MSTRRDFLRETTYGALVAFTGPAGVADAGLGSPSDARSEGAPAATDSDIGSLYPFVRSQAVEGEFEPALPFHTAVTGAAVATVFRQNDNDVARKIDWFLTGRPLRETCAGDKSQSEKRQS